GGGRVGSWSRGFVGGRRRPNGRVPGASAVSRWIVPPTSPSRTPSSTNHGLVPSFPSSHRPPSANSATVTAKVRPAASARVDSGGCWGTTVILSTKTEDEGEDDRDDPPQRNRELART